MISGQRRQWRPGRRPGLDGLRGIAVLFVVASHAVAAGGPMHSLGAVGVTVFFTLSGFLITTLLLGERERTGRVSLARFYWRRALRLAPALLAMVAAVVTAGAVLGSDYVGWPLVAGSLTYSANWVAAAGGGSGSALGHTWSLAIEEQFYLVWPLVLMTVGRSRRVLIGGCVAGIAVSVILRFVLYVGEGWQRAYYGSDARADALLVGCLLAALMHGTTARRPLPGIAVLGVLLAATCTFGPLGFIFTGMPLVVALTTAAAIWAIVQTEGGWTTLGPLVWVGQRSYGLYLWHYPVFLAVSTQLPATDALGHAVVAVPVSFALTALSWRYVETPFLRLKDRGQSSETVQSGQLTPMIRAVPGFTFGMSSACSAQGAVTDLIGGSSQE